VEENIGSITKTFYSSKFSEIKSLASLQELALNLVAFGCEFHWVVNFCRETGYISFTEKKLIRMVKENLDYVENLRNEFSKERLEYMVLSSSDVLPKFKTLYEQCLDLLKRADSSDDFRAASQLIGKALNSLEFIGRISGEIKEAESKVQINVFGHIENFNLLKKFQEDGLISVLKEPELKARLGFTDKPADFIENFRKEKEVIGHV